ncbi:TMEM173 [Mytilus coruscus]|uniref:TMEM173 n=1 Tax=Mytilus coruscus TaxID=42192 RepID=A0A6J8E3S5_MYTCO|nr:TMEM173 [Mytilus coruscus]
MAKETKIVDYLTKIKDVVNIKNLSRVYGKLGKTGAASVTLVSAFTAYKVFIQDLITGLNWSSGKITEKREAEERRKMIGNDVAHGLAWSHYCGYLQHVLPVIEEKIEQTEWYKKLPKDEKKKLPKKLYELIPRKCYVDIPGSDENIEKVSDIAIEGDRAGNKRKIKLQIYSIRDGKMKYYCVCECPPVLNTINNMNDIQTAGISRSTSSNLFFPWRKNPTLQVFTVDTKLVQLMRFYYAINALLCLKKDNKEKARFLLFNESEDKLSRVLLKAIKEDLKVDSSDQSLHSSLMGKKLQSAEENKDAFYQFDVFVTYPEDVGEHEKQPVEKMSKHLKARNMNILLEKDCLGKDWLEKMKFAATKCRWIVIVDKPKGSSSEKKSWFEHKGSKSKTLMSYKVVASLKGILESRKVQTVAIVNESDELHIYDDLRWVACIPFHNNEHNLIETLYKVMSGNEVKLENSTDLYLKPGEAAVGLAWGFAVNYLNKVLPEMKEKTTTVMDGKKQNFKLDKKLFLVVPESCKTDQTLKDIPVHGKTKLPDDSSRSYQFTMYKLHADQEKYFVGQYAAPVDVIYQMKEAGLLTEEQMKSEVKTFYTTVDKIMKILLQNKTKDYEFVFYNG